MRRTVNVRREIKGFTGQLIMPGDRDYDPARQIWNTALDRRPAIIATCATVADVRAVVRHAADTGVALSVRAGGHNYACTALTDDGIALDLRGLRQLAVAADGRTATLGAGLTWGEVDTRLLRDGLITTGGSVSKVGVSGFTLGSGLGWLGRRYGLAGDNVVGAECVTADGTVLSVGPEQHPELFWALRGGTGNFAVVTSWTMRLFPMREPVAGPLVYPLDDAPSVLRELAGLTGSLPADVTWTAVMTTAPPGPALPGELAGRPVLLVPVLFTGPPAAAAAALAPLRRIGKPVADQIGPVPFGTFQGSVDEAAPDGMAWDVRSEWLTRLDDAAIEHSVAVAAAAPSPLSEFVFRPLGGAIAAPDAPGTPFSFRHADLLVEIIANAPRGTVRPHREWLTKGIAGLAHVSAGGPDVNHIGIDEDPARVAAAYSPSVRARLSSVKAACDPGNLFRSVPYPLPAAT